MSKSASARRPSLLLAALLANALFAISFDASAQVQPSAVAGPTPTYDAGCNVNLTSFSYNFGSVSAGSQSFIGNAGQIYGGSGGCTYSLSSTDSNFVPYTATPGYCGYAGANTLNAYGSCIVAFRFAPPSGALNGARQGAVRVVAGAPQSSSSGRKAQVANGTTYIGAANELVGVVINGSDPSVSIPTASAGALAGMALAMAGLVGWRRRRAK
jgi:hypothetical protein